MSRPAQPEIILREARMGDLDAITAIYNDAVLNTTATFDTEPEGVEDRRAWFTRHGNRYPVIVAVLANEVVGWASLSRWSERRAYDGAAENSLYVRSDQRGKGIGTALLRALLEEGRRGGLHTVVARIADGNPASVRLHEAAGFQRIGVMREVGRKFGRLLDVTLMQRIYPD